MTTDTACMGPGGHVPPDRESVAARAFIPFGASVPDYPDLRLSAIPAPEGAPCVGTFCDAESGGQYHALSFTLHYDPIIPVAPLAGIAALREPTGAIRESIENWSGLAPRQGRRMLDGWRAATEGPRAIARIGPGRRQGSTEVSYEQYMDAHRKIPRSMKKRSDRAGFLAQQLILKARTIRRYQDKYGWPQ
jgi:hypothetical protein